MTAGVASGALADVYEANARFLWGLCYRLTGSAADADDLVQETFTRALAHPPARTHEPWRPWLVRVALNLGRDLLRRRRRRRYVGPWLPAPIETGDDASPPAFEPTVSDGTTTEGRYDLLESVSLAFLVALEALTPKQRAVLLLRDVFDYPVAETAAALEMSEASVKTTLHRARRAMAAYDTARCIPTRDLRDRTRSALERFVAGIASGDAAAVEALLAEDVRLTSDGAGEVHAARKPIVGRDRVLRFSMKLGARRTRDVWMALRSVNGLPALVFHTPPPRPGDPERFVITCTLDADGRIARFHTILAPAKLRAIRFGDR